MILPSGKRLHNYGTSPFLMGQLTISMAIFNSKLLVYQRVLAMAFFRTQKVELSEQNRLVDWYGDLY